MVLEALKSYIANFLLHYKFPEFCLMPIEVQEKALNLELSNFFYFDSHLSLFINNIKAFKSNRDSYHKDDLERRDFYITTFGL